MHCGPERPANALHPPRNTGVVGTARRAAPMPWFARVPPSLAEGCFRSAGSFTDGGAGVVAISMPSRYGAAERSQKVSATEPAQLYASQLRNRINAVQGITKLGRVIHPRFHSSIYLQLVAVKAARETLSPLHFFGPDMLLCTRRTALPVQFFVSPQLYDPHPQKEPVACAQPRK